jgi:hypothetical protein
VLRREEYEELNQKEKRWSCFICETLYAIAKKIRKLFIYPHLSKSQEEKMIEKFQLKGGISEPSSDIQRYIQS